jgi:translocation and assembly module TamB
VVCALVALAIGLGAGVVYAPLTSVGRDFIAAQIGGLKIGRAGRLELAGLKGNIWSDFTLQRLQIVDERGAWLEARDIRVRWSPADLIERRVHIDRLTARLVTVLRRPVLAPAARPKPRSVAIQIDAIAARLSTLAAFSIQPGLYDLSASAELPRAGGARIAAFAASALRPGDFLRLRLDQSRASFVLEGDATEARGGALAGSLGLDPTKAFRLTARAHGSSAAGRFDIAARLGAARPLEMAGDWSPSGGAARGRVDLAASSLLATWAAKLGPHATFAVLGSKAHDGFYAVGIALRADNAALDARGEADLGRRLLGPRGLAIDLRLADASRVFPGAKLGAARLRGGLGGGAGHWVFSGVAQADRPAFGGFVLARVAGPVRLASRGGDLMIEASARGQGGAGRGLAAALLGASPSGSAQLTRLADGRVLIRRLTLAGPGLQLAASGERGLLGALAFRGSATFANLAAAHPGARGVIKATWSASQGRAGQPWSLSLDAAGENFAAGLAEVDRLVGASPRLRLAAEVRAGAIAVRNAALDGAAGSVSAAGTLVGNRDLAMKLNWRAQGPFRVGPLEIDGAARGDGALTGTLAQPKADLAADFDHLDIPALPLAKATVRVSLQSAPEGPLGHIAVTGASEWGPSRGAAAFRFATAGLDLSDVDLDAGGVLASGSVSLRRGEPSSADLAFAVGRGAVLLEGSAKGRLKIVDAPGGARASLVLAARDARLVRGGLAIGALELRAEGPLARLPYDLTAEGESGGGPWRLAGSGEYGEGGGGQTASFSGSGKVRRVEVRTLAPARLALGAARSSADLHLAVGGGRADVDIASAGGELTARGSLAGVGLDLINRDYVGRFDADFALAGKGPDLAGHALMRLTGAGGRDLEGSPPVDGVIKAGLAKGALAVDASFTNAKGLTARADLVLPAQASASPFRIAIDRAAPVKGRFALSGETKPIWDLLMGADRPLSGRVTASGTLGGTLQDPKALGSIALDGGRFEDSQTGLKLENVFLRATLLGDAIDVAHLEAADDTGGVFSGKGRISLQRDGVSSFRLVLDRFGLIDNETAQASASGVATISRAADGRVKLSGALTIDRARIAPRPPVPSGVVAMDVVEIHRPAARAETDLFVAKPPAPVALDVTFKAARGVLVRGRGLDVDLSLDGRVEGTTADPVLTGTARIVRGDYDFAGQRFTFDDLGSVRLASRAEDIRLDLTATRENPTLTAVIRIRGTAAKPDITLTSNPVLPTDEVLSQVLFGASASQLTGLQAAQLASALSGLASGGGLDVLGGLRTFAHLDRLALGSAATGGAVVGGKYLRNNVYLELGAGGHGGGSAQVEWRVYRRLSLVSRLGGQGDSGLSIRWRKDF